MTASQMQNLVSLLEAIESAEQDTGLYLDGLCTIVDSEGTRQVGEVFLNGSSNHEVNLGA